MKSLTQTLLFLATTINSKSLPISIKRASINVRTPNGSQLFGSYSNKIEEVEKSTKSEISQTENLSLQNIEDDEIDEEHTSLPFLTMIGREETGSSIVYWFGDFIYFFKSSSQIN